MGVHGNLAGTLMLVVGYCCGCSSGQRSARTCVPHHGGSSADQTRHPPASRRVSHRHGCAVPAIADGPSPPDPAHLRDDQGAILGTLVDDQAADRFHLRGRTPGALHRGPVLLPLVAQLVVPLVGQHPRQPDALARAELENPHGHRSLGGGPLRARRPTALDRPPQPPWSAGRRTPRPPPRRPPPANVGAAGTAEPADPARSPVHPPPRSPRHDRSTSWLSCRGACPRRTPPQPQPPTDRKMPMALSHPGA
ncbi:hypothetical protein GA0070618_2804 [Micromonospora echinospora]|uniref:Uncharacterized protein n=1 Tax=Micromonospora echinospora TaxID=1877 RepID=A0A1C4X6S4_MICEC|nr:hypothetical protein GA0070618_2804 [Micromonospora echinospora]